MLIKLIFLFDGYTTRDKEESMCIDMAKLILEKKLDDKEKNPLENLKKYRVKISMIRPYEIVDFWAKKPDVNNALEAFLDELSILNPSEYFKIEVSES
jgi:hypothetical protein